MARHEHLYELAIVKGLIEHCDGTAYFGSLLGFETHLANAIECGLVAGDIHAYSITCLGEDVYHTCRLDTLPRERLSRAYAWNWSNIPPLKVKP